MQQAEEDALVIAAQSGNQKAFEVIYRKYQKPLIQYAYKVCADTQVAEDVVQDAWIRLAKNIRKLEDPRAFRSWLYKTVHWRALDLKRRSSRRDHKEEEFQDEHHFVEEKNLDDMQALGRAIKSLPTIERQMIHLFYLDELRISEIGIVLDIPSGTVKSRLNRARKILKEKFESE